MTARDARYLLRDAACRNWSTYRILVGLKWNRYRSVAIRRSTELVIEGFPRSANTFAVAAFAVAQGTSVEALHIARHSHAPAQVARATQRGLPTILLIRKPEDAVISLVQRERVSLPVALDSYIAFHRAVAPYAEHTVIASFDEVTSDFGSVIRRLNRRYGTRYREFTPIPANVEMALRLVEDMERLHAGGPVLESRVARPSGARDLEKPRLRCALTSGSFKAQLERASDLYSQFAAHAGECSTSTIAGA